MSTYHTNHVQLTWDATAKQLNKWFTKDTPIRQNNGAEKPHNSTEYVLNTGAKTLTCSCKLTSTDFVSCLANRGK